MRRECVGWLVVCWRWHKPISLDTDVRQSFTLSLFRRYTSTEENHDSHPSLLAGARFQHPRWKAKSENLSLIILPLLPSKECFNVCYYFSFLFRNIVIEAASFPPPPPHSIHWISRGMARKPLRVSVLMLLNTEGVIPANLRTREVRICEKRGMTAIFEVLAAVLVDSLLLRSYPMSTGRCFPIQSSWIAWPCTIIRNVRRYLPVDTV